MEESLTKILHLKDISQSLQTNIDRSWALIIVPNVICVAGAFFAGFGVMHSMVFNQIGAVVALANGLLPLRKVAEAQAEKERAAEQLLGEHPISHVPPPLPTEVKTLALPPTLKPERKRPRKSSPSKRSAPPERLALNLH